MHGHMASRSWARRELDHLNKMECTFFDDLIVDCFPLKTHGLKQFLRVIEFYLFSPSDHKDESEDRVEKVIYFKSLNDEFGLKVFAVNDTVGKG